ncbi:6797_t:CDS:1, partial [Cetraspora pellucida]
MELVISYKIEIKRGNYDLQFHSFSAFSPLFIATGRSKYAQSTTHFLAQVSEDPFLQRLLHYACLVNLTYLGHYLALDEAIEVYRVKCVKQNIKPNIMNNEKLKLQILSVQPEIDRVKILISDYMEDII